MILGALAWLAVRLDQFFSLFAAAVGDSLNVCSGLLCPVGTVQENYGREESRRDGPRSAEYEIDENQEGITGVQGVFPVMSHTCQHT